MCTKFGVDRSGRFSFTERTDTHTHRESITDYTDHPSTDVVGNYVECGCVGGG